ncbi:CheY-P phosphatase CheC [Legionella quinlivanii]|uniref:CheY-P phosphatase CheC n=1 Tax=Legionella quinlivanii TaxID=45073 RepID=A0A0W0XPT7_9GAMM|nr:chemotaxis protein CheC [Legionella quinlivanii]KTD46527.1 CheY-P phosphatase CheC [Legionella quinlivanii]MCW8451563.1 chemotaxis protein CheC [Legionella quinlivanii]SEG10202.1 chemotaxis protein CheC [Legionella quinlivanii DSM 21216]STY10215.1 CheY-P phosphatase CheC [Legionella quinlivanii]
MISLTAEQEDALIEIGNIGMSKAAKQLSLLLNSTIKISIPKITFININELTEDNDFNDEQVLSYVYQNISQDLEGSAALVFQREQANVLTVTVIGEAPQLTQEEARACEQEAMLEIGNIIISSCLSVIMNMLSQTVKLSLPVYNENNLYNLLQNLCRQISKLTRNIIAISTKLETSNDKLSGSLFIILTEDSVIKLLRSIKELIND